MGAASSKPVAAIEEKKAGAPSNNYSSSSSNHHATDRLYRINAEATISRQGSPLPSAARQHRHQRAMPEHESTNAEISMSALKAWDSVALDDPTSRMAALTLHNTVIRDSVRRRTAETIDQHVFSHVIPMQGLPIVNQLSSGRCWLFATTNVVRLQVMKELNIKEFELSQSYLAFWDKLEKSNTFLENSIELADRPLDDRVFGFLKTAPTNDGGQWDMVTNLIKKYGLVPKVIFPESYNSSNSSQINWLLTVKLREYAIELRQLKKATLNSLKKAASSHSEAGIMQHTLQIVRQRKDEQMAEVYRMMVIALGVPPKPEDEFNWEFYDRNNKFHSISTNPLEFLDKYTGSFDPSGACSLVNDPRRAYNKLISVDRLQNVWGGQPVLYVNTSTQQMKDCVVASIKAGLPVFFGCDVGQFSARNGIMDTELYDYELAFDIKLGLSKAERLELGESSMTHAMVLTGVHLDGKGKPVRYRVENSWGETAGEKGYMVMTDAWFDEFVYQVVIRKQHMPLHLWKLFETGIDKDTDILPPYDPMGSLASSGSVMEVDESTAVATSDDPAIATSDDPAIVADAEEDTESVPEDEYEIEAILSHRVGQFRKNEIAYLVSWKGYGAEHNSWVSEGDAENAPDMISSYWAVADKAGVAKKANGKGWTGARSNFRVKKESPEAPHVAPVRSRRGGNRSNSSQEEQLVRKRAKIANQMSYTRAGLDLAPQSIEFEDELSEKQLKGLSADEQLLRKQQMEVRQYQSLATWETVVKHVETVERSDSGKLIVFLIFENGQRYAYEAAVANHRCPQKMISFYESRLRFKTDAADLPPLNTVSMSQPLQSSNHHNHHEAVLQNDASPRSSEQAMNTTTDVVTEETQTDDGTTIEQTTTTTTTTTSTPGQGIIQAVY